MITVQFNRKSSRFNVLDRGVVIMWYTQASIAYAKAHELNNG